MNKNATFKTNGKPFETLVEKSSYAGFHSGNASFAIEKKKKFDPKRVRSLLGNNSKKGNN